MMEHAIDKGHRVLCNTTLVGLTPEIITRLEKIQNFKDFSVYTYHLLLTMKI